MEKLRTFAATQKWPGATVMQQVLVQSCFYHPSHAQVLFSLLFSFFLSIFPLQTTLGSLIIVVYHGLQCSLWYSVEYSEFDEDDCPRPVGVL